jgi:hypothetical protein
VVLSNAPVRAVAEALLVVPQRVTSKKLPVQSNFIDEREAMSAAIIAAV